MSDHIKPVYEVRLVGRATSDAVMESVSTKNGTRPVCKFRMMVSSGKNRKTQEWQEPFWFSVKCWGDRAEYVRKGTDVELFGVMKRQEYMKAGEKKTWDEIEVATDEHGEPQINYEGRPVTTKGVSDEQIASGKAPVIQVGKPQSSLEITDADIPF